MIELVEKVEQASSPSAARIKVIGVGGAGGNTVNSIIRSGDCSNIEFIAANTDSQALDQSKADHVIQLGTKLTKGLGSGADPEIGRRATEEDIETIAGHLQNADIVFLTAGLGGGTGSGGIPVVARALRERNILSVAVVTKPFDFEGRRRMRVAEETLAQLRKNVDTLIVIPNQKLLAIAEKKLSLIDAFETVNTYMGQFVKSISNIITKPGHINVDFADVQAIMRNMGTAVMGTGRATGENRAEEATMQAISSPLLETQSIAGARGVLLNITGNTSISLHEVSVAAQIIYSQVNEDANIVLGSVIDESMDDSIAVTIIATGFEKGRDQEIIAAEPVKTGFVDQMLMPDAKQPGQQPRTQLAKKLEHLTPDDIEIPALLRRPQSEHQMQSQESSE